MSDGRRAACRSIAPARRCRTSTQTGKLVEPKEPNALKFEKFIFDLLPAAKRALVVEVDPAEAFAPVKNAPGAKTDSPEWVRAQMIAQATRWLQKAGAKVARDTPVEISPLVGSRRTRRRGECEAGNADRETNLFRNAE